MRPGNPYILLLVLLLGAHVHAATIIVNPNTVVSVNAIVDSLTGSDMTGLIATAEYAGPSSPIVVPMTWEATGPVSGAASSSPAPGETPTVSISLSGDTSGNLAWNYSSLFLSPLLSLQFDGTAAGVYFDRANPNPGTPGSGPGNDIAFGPLFPPGVDSGIVVTYSGAVAIDGNPPQNDLYAKLRIDFPNSLSGQVNFPPQDFSFTQDTDHSAVPEPPSWVLAAGASGLLAGAFRSHQRSKAPNDSEFGRTKVASRARSA